MTYTADEMMTVSAARALRDGMTCFVGIGLPSSAANLARATHAPSLVLIYESGTIGAKPDRLPLSIGDGMLAETADAVVSVPEIFNYWLQPGRIDVGFLGAAQIDKFGNINTTVIGGDYGNPKVRLPGAGGAPEIAASCREVIVVVRQNHRSFVERVDFVTSVGYGSGRGDRERLGLTGAGPKKIITDLGVLEPDPETLEFTLTGLYPGVSASAAKERTGWDLAIAADPEIIAAPTPAELDALRDAFQGTQARSHQMTTADVSASLAGAEAGRLVLPSYERPAAGVHPPLDFEGYRSTALRHPKQPLVLLPHRLTEVTGPLLGDGLITATDSDLTTQHDGEPQGQRIIVTGQVLDSGRAAGARHADRDLADERGRALPALARAPPRAPRPELRRDRARHHRRGRPVPVRHHPARRLSVGEPLQRLAARRTSTSRCSAGRSPSGWSPRCTSPATRCCRSTRSSTRCPTRRPGRG